MIHLTNIKEVQYISVPKGKPSEATPLELTFRNTTDLHKEETQQVNDIGSLVYYYLFAVAIGNKGDFNVDFNDDFFTWFPITPGEYEYTLTAGGKPIASGIAIVDEYGASVKEFKNEVTYKQYEPKR